MAEAEAVISDEERDRANQRIVKYLHNILDDGRKEITALRRKLAVTYWVIIALSVVMFFVGIALLSVPAIAGLQRRITELPSIIAGGFGIADLAALFLFRPVERIHGLMGDMGQITLALNSFQNQVGLRLLEIDKDKRDTIGRAAEHIKEAAKSSINVIQIYFEAKRET